MNLLALYDQAMRRDLILPDMQRETGPGWVRQVRPAPGMSHLVWSALDETTAEVAIEAQITYFAALKQRFTWKHYAHDTPADLPARLQARGFVRDDDVGAILALDLAAAPATLLAPVTADVRLVTAPAQLADVVKVEEAVWGGNFNWIYQRFGHHLTLPGFLSLYVAYVENEPAAVGWTHFYPENVCAGLWGGSTIERFRQRGLYTALLATRVQEALRRGRCYLVIEASPMSRPIVEGHGFQRLTTKTDYEWKGTDGNR